MPGRAIEQAPQAQQKQADILDQLMLDGAVQEPQLGTVNGLPANNWAGEAQPNLMPLRGPACQCVPCSMLCRRCAAASTGRMLCQWL